MHVLNSHLSMPRSQLSTIYHTSGQISAATAAFFLTDDFACS
jgi:hypothetical protein